MVKTCRLYLASSSFPHSRILMELSARPLPNVILTIVLLELRVSLPSQLMIGTSGYQTVHPCTMTFHVVLVSICCPWKSSAALGVLHPSMGSSISITCNFLSVFRFPCVARHCLANAANLDHDGGAMITSSSQLLWVNHIARSPSLPLIALIIRCVSSSVQHKG